MRKSEFGALGGTTAVRTDCGALACGEILREAMGFARGSLLGSADLLMGELLGFVEVDAAGALGDTTVKIVCWSSIGDKLLREAMGTAIGRVLDSSDGRLIGEPLGFGDEAAPVSEAVEAIVGDELGVSLGASEGESDGIPSGAAERFPAEGSLRVDVLGGFVGEMDGIPTCAIEGFPVGGSVGVVDGVLEGVSEGDELG